MSMKLSRFLFVTFIILSVIVVQAQDSKLANSYFRNGEYEKAAEVYKRMFDKTGKNDYYFERYIASLLEVENFEQAEDAIKGQIKKRPKEMQLYVQYGVLYDKQFMPGKSKQMYQKAISNINGNVHMINKLGSSFARSGNYDLAIQVYESSKEVPELQYNYSYQLADMYRRTGKVSKMQDEFLNSLIKSEKRMKSVKTIFQRELDKEGYTMLQTKLYERMTEQSEMEIFPEMLMWTFITQKQYDKALRQARALDRQFEENGGRVFDIAEIALDDNYYDTAIKGFEYITTKKGINTSYYLEAKRGLLKAKRFKITKDYSYTQEDLLALEAEYILFMAEYGRNSQTVLLMQEYAELQAIYMNDIDEAIEVLEELIGFAGVEKYALNQSKINLADYKLIQGDIWESTLLYSQVDKEFKEASIGEEARYRNAKLSYYIGDFEWAQEQFDILKRATSKLISNDAIDKAVFIMDNMALDTTDAPLKMYSGSELLIFQNRFEEAQTKLDSITTIYPEHSLEDDVFYSKAQIHMKKREYQDAIGFYEKIIEKFPEEIRADNALFEMAQLFELILQDKVKALELYEKLFLEYSGSTFAVEARKRFRILRGDEI